MDTEESFAIAGTSLEDNLEGTLEELFEVVSALEAQPNDISLLRRNVDLTNRAHMSEENQQALEMLVKVVGCPPSVWIEVLTATKKVDMKTKSTAAVVQMLENALADYASLDVGTIVADLIDALYPAPSRPRPDEDTNMEDRYDISPLINEDVARSLWKAVVSMIEKTMAPALHLWTRYIEWEEATALAKPEGDSQTALRALHGRFISHLAVPHDHLEETAAAYSNFNTKHFLNDYEPNMVKASAMCAKSLAKYRSREACEDGWKALKMMLDRATEGSAGLAPVQDVNYLSAWLETELSLVEAVAKQKGKKKHREEDGLKSEPFFIIMVFERLLAAIRCSSNRSAKTHEGATWIRYHRYMHNTNGIAKAEAAKVLTRAARCCPESGEVWAALLRLQEANHKDAAEIGETYARALSLGLLTQQPTDSTVSPQPLEDLVSLEMAWCGFVKRMWESQDMDFEDTPDMIEQTLRDSIARVRSIFSQMDSASRLELFLISWLERKGKVEEADQVWDDMCKSRPKECKAWIGRAEFLIRHAEYARARSTLKIAAKRVGMNWPEVIWDTWLSFEHHHGSIEQVNTALTQISILSEDLARRRAEVGSATATAFQQPVNPPETPQATVVNQTLPGKRKAEDDIADRETGDSKRTKREQAGTVDGSESVSTLSRDRESSTVLISGLNDDANETNIRDRFKDCGDIRDVNITRNGSVIAATVEFQDKESVSAALTKDRKKIGSAEVHVYQASQTTVFVTNFPAGLEDDTAIRELFESFGEIIDTRWPSKKYKDSRRFCYVQFLTADAAHAACELHGRELEADLPLTVLISDPERKKRRTDANSELREVYITGLSRFVAEKDVRRVFEPFGDIKRINVASDEEGHCRGFAFVEFLEERSVESALVLDGSELKKRTMRVKRVDPKAKSNQRGSETSVHDRHKEKEIKDRSIKLTGLPPKTQDGLLQQCLEKLTNVKRVEVFNEEGKAIVELAAISDVGALLLRGETIKFGDAELEVFSLEQQKEPIRVPSSVVRGDIRGDNPASISSTPAQFKPRPPKAGGKRRMLALPVSAPISISQTGPRSDMSDTKPAEQNTEPRPAMKDQDDFRKMLLSKKSS